MILVLSGADFSQDNIGNIPLVRELTTEVKAILANFTRPLTDDQKFAFQTFYYGLKNNGILDKIQNLFCPALAANVTEAFHPIKGGGIINEYTKEYSLYNHGLRIASTLDNSTTPAKAAFTGSTMDVHIASYLSYLDTDVSDQSRSVFNGITSGSGTSVLQAKLGRLGEFWVSGSVKTFGISPPSLPQDQGEKSLFVVQSSGTESLFYVGDGNKLSGSTDPLSNDSPFGANGKFVIGSNVNNVAYNVFSQSLISSGAALTDAQALKYNELADALMAELL